MLSIRRLICDAWNVAYIARHDVTPEEVEQVCQGTHITRQAHEERVIVIGPTRTDRVLALILDPEGEGVYYPVTAQPASRKERHLYEQGRAEKT